MEMNEIRGSDFKLEELNPTFLFTWKGTGKGANASYHCHDYPQIAFVLSGSGRYCLDGNELEIAEGDLLIINPGVYHQWMKPADPENAAVVFFVGFLDVQLEGYPANHLPMPDGNYILHTTGELRQKLFKICSSMEAENADCRQGRYYMLKSYLMQLLVLVIREQALPVPTAKGYSFESVSRKYVVEQMLSFFEDHYSEKISLDQIAENMYLSPFYISKIFKSETGASPIRHLINIRLEKAKELLEKGESGSIQEVANAVGYEDAYHFSKLFKKKYGISPSQARK